MAIARRTSIQSGNSGASGATNLVLSHPTDAVAGDILIAIIAVADNVDLTAAPTATMSAGWNQLGTGVIIGTYERLQAWWKLDTGSEASTYTATMSRTSIVGCWNIVAYSGADQTTPIGTRFAFKATPNSSLTDTTDSVTPATVNDWIIAAFTDRSSTAGQQTTGWAATSPNTERTEQNTNGHSSQPTNTLEYCDDGAVAGSVTTKTRTSVRTGPPANANWNAIIISLTPASATVEDIIPIEGGSYYGY